MLVVTPKDAAPGRPWCWHGEFFGQKPAPDIALLGRGFHIAYMSVPNLLGGPAWLSGESLSYEWRGIKEPSTAISPPLYLWMADANKEEGSSNGSAQNSWIRGGILVEG